MENGFYECANAEVTMEDWRRLNFDRITVGLVEILTPDEDERVTVLNPYESEKPEEPEEPSEDDFEDEDDYEAAYTAWEREYAAWREECEACQPHEWPPAHRHMWLASYDPDLEKALVDSGFSVFRPNYEVFENHVLLFGVDGGGYNFDGKHFIPLRARLAVERYNRMNRTFAGDSWEMQRVPLEFMHMMMQEARQNAGDPDEISRIFGDAVSAPEMMPNAADVEPKFAAPKWRCKKIRQPIYCGVLSGMGDAYSVTGGELVVIRSESEGQLVGRVFGYTDQDGDGRKLSKRMLVVLVAGGGLRFGYFRFCDPADVIGIRKDSESRGAFMEWLMQGELPSFAEAWDCQQYCNFSDDFIVKYLSEDRRTLRFYEVRDELDKERSK